MVLILYPDYRCSRQATLHFVILLTDMNINSIEPRFLTDLPLVIHRQQERSWHIQTVLSAKPSPMYGALRHHV
jgi:hypothetical protein